MAMELRGGGWQAQDWPASRTLAVIGGVFGITAAVLLLMGLGAATMGIQAVALPGITTSLAVVGVVNIVLAILIFVSAGLLTRNAKLHGGLLVLWGVIGMFFAFGLWFGTVLVIIAGFLAYLQATPRAPMTRGPVA